MRNAVLRGRPGNQIEAGVPALAHAAQPEGEPIVVMERNVVKENI